MRDHGVPALVVGDQPALLLIHHTRLPLGSRHHAVDGFFDLLHRDRALGTPRREQGGLVDHVRQVRAGEPGGPAREHRQVHRGVERLAARVHLQDGLAAFQVRPVDDHLPVEPAGAQQRRVQDVGTVRGGHQDDGRPLIEAVHLHE